MRRVNIIPEVKEDSIIELLSNIGLAEDKHIRSSKEGRETSEKILEAMRDIPSPQLCLLPLPSAGDKFEYILNVYENNQDYYTEKYDKATSRQEMITIEQEVVKLEEWFTSLMPHKEKGVNRFCSLKCRSMIRVAMNRLGGRTC